MKQQPFQFMMPMFGPQQEAPEMVTADIVVPARVNKAMQFLSMLNDKQMDRAAASDNQIQIIDGKKLSPEEEATKQVALNMLAHYFDGNLQPDNWETIKSQSLSCRNKKKAISGKLRAMSCPACGGAPGDKNCPLCDGKGTLVIVSGTGGPVKKRG